ncbi:MAG: hypothetical protein ACJAZ2_002026 [Glaciecola sp.]|jgi:hypothetical protein
MIQSIIILVFSTILIRFLIKFKGASKKDLDRAELTKEFRAFDLRLLFGFFFLLLANTIVLTYFLHQLSKLELGSESIPEYVIKPGLAAWGVVGMMLSLSVSFAILIFLVSQIKKEKAPNYWRYYNLKYGFNASGILKHLCIVIVCVATVFYVSQVNSYVKFYSDSIVINKMLETAGRTYQYSEVSEITHYLKKVAPNGNVVDKPHYEIKFKDGFTWRTTDDLRTPNIHDDKIFNWLLEQTGLTLKEQELDKQ